MNRLLVAATLVFAVLASPAALAEQKTITLAVQNMDCADCPFIVRKSLERVPGVVKASVSFEDKTAIVVYDDSKAGVATLTNATTSAGYPSAPKN